MIQQVLKVWLTPVQIRELLIAIESASTGPQGLCFDTFGPLQNAAKRLREALRTKPDSL